MRGRRPSGPAYVERLEGSALAKERLQVVLETLAGRCRVQEACARLAISEPRFHQLREQALVAALERLEPRPAGRPALTPSPAEEQVRLLEQQVVELEVERRAAEARAEIALVLPRVVPAPDTPDAQKKSAPAAAPGLDVEAAPAAWQEDAHVNRLQELCRPQTPDADAMLHRHFGRQRQQREREQRLRADVVALSTWSGELGWTLAETAALLQLSPRTLGQWQAHFGQGHHPLLALGRPLVRAARHERNQVLGLLDELGPATGLPTLQEAFPELARAELDNLLKRYRRVWRQRHPQDLHVLHWQLPGSVWAMDFAEAPTPLDGLYPYLLAVRDLAGGQQLLWLPLATATSPEVVQALAALFVLHGAPLVLKTDNGSAFGAEATLAFLAQAQVIPLFSPPYRPSYNGAIEAGIGSLKTRTERQAGLHGRPGHWTWDDAAAARLEANATARPRGPSGPTPGAIWQARRPLSAGERVAFQATVQRRRQEERATDRWPTEGPLTVSQERALDREAIRRALEEHGYLLYSRRRIPLPFKKKKVANIS